jgi:hypothetical protein
MAEGLPIKHDIVVSRPEGQHAAEVATCSCGWKSEGTSTEETRQQVEEHLEEFGSDR